MTCELLTQCDLIFGLLKCALPEDTIDVDLKICTLKGIHTFWKDYKSHITKCSPWGTEVQHYPSLKKKMVEFMRYRWTIAMPFAHRSFQPRPKVVAKKCKLVPITRPNRATLSQARKINVKTLPEVTQQNWASTIGRSLSKKPRMQHKEHQSAWPLIWGSQLMGTPSMLSPISPKAPIKFTEHSRYCAICTPLRKSCQKEFPMSLDWDDDEEEKDQVKHEDKNKGNEQKPPQTNPRFFAVMTIILKPPKPSITEYFSKMSRENPITDDSVYSCSIFKHYIAYYYVRSC